jgi:hypothetical protein
MSRQIACALLLVGSLVELAGCTNLLKKRDPDPAPSAAPVVVTAPPVVASAPVASAVPEAPPTAVALDETTVPTTEDFEDEAFAKVTPANFRAQLVQLKAEISKP